MLRLLQPVLAFVTAFAFTRADADDFSVEIHKDGYYIVNVGGQPWLNRASTFFITDGRPFSTFDDTLSLTQTTQETGLDKLGKWNSTNVHYQAGSAQIIASVRQYVDPPRPMAVFSQRYVNGANMTEALNDNSVIGGFPSFKLEGMPGKLGYLSYGGEMFGDENKRMGSWNLLTKDIQDGLAGGPLSVFDQRGSAVVISPFNQFMAASVWHEGIVGGAVHWGIMGGINSVPAGFVYETIIFFSDQGINKAFEGWGEVLKTQYNKEGVYRHSDLTLNYMGYWTDGGAYYYYNTEKNKTYEETILDVKTYTDSLNLPFRYVQYDSWWYYKGPAGGDILWEPMADVFPHGLQYMYNMTGWPAGAHNRYWSSLTKYAKQNGGQFQFTVETLKSVPVEEAFWDYLFTRAREWGLILYEQDWLHNEFEGLEAMLTDLDLGRLWLLQMGNAARKHGISILYCMSYPRQALQTLEIPAVTMARVSDDYRPGNGQWKIGISSIFAEAVNIAPFKDTFWTTTNQPGSPYGISEPFPALQAVVSTLSTGPVGPSDMIGGTNKSLLMRCCNEDGLILKPSKPARAINSQIIQAAFGGDIGPEGEVWSTYSIVSGLFFGIILAADLQRPFSITPEAAGFRNQNMATMIYSHREYDHVMPFNQSSPYLLKNCSTVEFCLLYTSPVLKVGKSQVVILGEISKWVPVSSQRVLDVSYGSDIRVTVKGSTDEDVTLFFLVDEHVASITCRIGASGGLHSLFLGSSGGTVATDVSFHWPLKEISCANAATAVGAGGLYCSALKGKINN